MHSFAVFALQGMLFSSVIAQPAEPRTIYQFPKPTWLENIATTRSGHLLTGVLASAPASLHIVDPISPSNNTLLHSFLGFDSVFGISEYAPDLFAVAAGNYSPATGPTNGSASVWSVDVSCLNGTRGAKVSKIADVPDMTIINGVAALNSKSLLLADSFAGVVRLDIETGKYGTVIDDASTAFEMPLGVNGLKVIHSTNPPTLFYTNSQLNSTFSAPINATTGALAGSPTLLANHVHVPDDLAVTEDGTAFFGQPYEGTLTRVRKGANATIIAGAEGSPVLGGITSATLGRSYRDREIVYVATMGGFAADGSYAEGGKIVAVDMRGEVAK